MNDKRTTERRPQTGEERFRVIFDSVNDGILVIALGTYTFIDANPRMCELFGYSRPEMLELDIDRLSADVSPETLSARVALIERATSGEAQNYRGVLWLITEGELIVEAVAPAGGSADVFPPVGSHIPLTHTVISEGRSTRSWVDFATRWRNYA